MRRYCLPKLLHSRVKQPGIVCVDPWLACFSFASPRLPNVSISHVTKPPQTHHPHHHLHCSVNSLHCLALPVDERTYHFQHFCGFTLNQGNQNKNPFLSRISVTSVPQLIITGDWGTKPPLLQQISRYLRCPKVQTHRHQSHHHCLASTLITLVCVTFAH
jgi:hypothetical protein